MELDGKLKKSEDELSTLSIFFFMLLWLLLRDVFGSI